VQSISSCCSADTIVPQLRVFADLIKKCGEQVGVEKGSCSSSTLSSLEMPARWSLVDTVDGCACEVMGTLVRIGVLCKDWQAFWGSNWIRSRTVPPCDGFVPRVYARNFIIIARELLM
jgi:hypothetical protein